MTTQTLSDQKKILPMTPAQRAQIRIVDLANPPPFIRVVRRVEDLREISEDTTPGVNHWLYVHDWGGLADMFNTKQTQKLLRSEENLNTIARIRRDQDGFEGRALLHDSYMNWCAELFDNERGKDLVLETVALGRKILQLMPSASLCTVRLRFEMNNAVDARNEPKTMVHQDDGIGVRGFFATEHHNLIIPDTEAAAAKGFDFIDLDNHVTQLIDAGVPVYTPPLGVIPFMRHSHHRHRSPPSWHAVHEMRPDATYCRPCFTLDFS